MLENITPPRILFYQNHKPAMVPGDYTITVSGTISHRQTNGKNDAINSNNTASATTRFAVYGERFTIQEQDVRAIFPASGSTGEYASVLPHVIINRNTLPWERHAFTTNKDLPWLALLLFDESEVPEKKIITVAALKNTPSGTINFPAFSIETAQNDEEALTVIDVPKAVLVKILPSAASLLLLAHTRQGVNETHELVGEENAVVFSNRLPAQGVRSTMHLVSVEGRYNANGFDFSGNGNLFRLVSLKSWEFYTLEHFKITGITLSAIKDKASEDLPGLSTLLDREFAGTESSFLDEVAQVIGKSAVPDAYKNDLIAGARFDKTFDGLLKGLNKDLLTLRLPPNTDTAAERFLSQGLTPLVHHFRNGDQSVSWYRGPFLPFQPKSVDDDAVQKLLPETSDDLSQFYAENGMFNVTYSAAWEIGRLMALSSKDFSVNLFKWKRLTAQHVHKTRQSAAHEHLPVFAHGHNHELEKSLWDLHLQPWLNQLATLQNIPGNYLLPDEKLLPKESIRFFYVDKNWLVAALSGAFSVGGDWDAASQKDDNFFNDFLDLEGCRIKGFLLRSDLVDGWPGLIIDGYDANNTKLLPLRRQLSKNILLCLFDADIDKVVFHQKTEVMHLGLEKDNENFLKRIRNEDGTETNITIPITWQSNSGARVINMAELAKGLNKDGRPASFAMNMIEGIPRVIFNIKNIVPSD
ncbi:hypothetical protein SAMN05518672_103600 [Chitinophaga sp. CF118]|uniref:hypothetical protein n=1 Tax=Chitinophaga sp. CF118 TaxID=1884367 RepID=UPI0008E1FD38|nr:hypothetical protein [Chitinophaga sp. CF118]SFD86850.1 hypothetical protein SAMN05518672_103600 [Chitinophaga sp. CF118]